MQKVALNVELREGTGKGAARQVRAGGKVPAIMYGQGGATPISIDRKEFVRLLNAGGGSGVLLAVNVAGTEGERLAVVKDYQTSPIKNELLHADLLEVALDKPIHVTVHVVVEGKTPKGVKEGGILQQLTRELLVDCLPANIPEHISVDASEVGVGESIHVGDLKLPEGVKTSHVELDQVVLTIAAPISAEKLEAMLTAEAEVKEPEVLGKAKEEA
ncbi:MAG: 50S ribosomal protein L25 [Nitrospirae bacterium]|nr:50S ribosomal protein L25 [Nitrospirota bacterium]MBI5695788.1 50S ribosomal protein L25 [Nitrospirota bacterium]